MGTSWEEIEGMAVTYIKNDPELNFNLANRRPVFFNTMTAFMKLAVPLFNRPPEILVKLRDHTEPDFGDVEIELQELTVGEFTADTGLTGYDICSAGIITEDKFGRMVYEPVKVTGYDSTAGTVTMNGNYPAGTVITVECYKGAEFRAELNDTEKQILAYAIYDVYEHRFDNDVLERMMKINDRNFTTRSEAGHMQANTARQKEVDRQLWGMMRAYQDNIEYLNIVKNANY